ncbi:hypothetical protein [Sedimentibacter sp. B4]|uniref:hypothetical protein n=1 Tax=Sedimentibacter sp. B4 TaxID=304766 RepID=UPI00031A6693|nr:hypothetical protein [Sedimentibacter sp. B4]
MSIEHIIPKSLGGSDEFIIYVDKQLNSVLGSTVDGKYVNDPLVRLRLLHENHKGHSKKEQEVKFINSSINNKPVSVTFKKSGIDIYDPIIKKHIKPNGEITTGMTINLYTRVKFIAKVALASGYYILGDSFVKGADHDSLRRLIFSKNIRNEDLDLFFIDNLHINEKDKDHVKLISLLIEFLGGTNVILQIFQTRIIVDIGIDGKYIGGVSFKAESNNIPYQDATRLGQIINIKNGTMIVKSFWRAIFEMNKAYNVAQVDDSILDVTYI